MKTVLIVEDSAPHRLIISEALKSAGYQIIESSNGIEALEILHNPINDIDIITVDYAMPKMNGSELLRAIRRDKKIQEIREQKGKNLYLPVVVITVFSTAKEVKEMKKVADYFLLKPLIYKDIIEAVNKTLVKF